MMTRTMGLLIFFLLFGGCEENFSPVAPYEPKIVVYSILQADRDTQMVRVCSSYYPPNDDPLQNADENPIMDAQVTLVEGTSSYFLRDTVIQRKDKSRYQSDIFAYYVTPLRPRRGAIYTLNINSPTYGAVSSQVSVPDTVQFTLTGTNLVHLMDPWITSQPITIPITLSAQAKAYSARLFMYFTSNRLGNQQELRVEVPLNVSKTCAGGSVFFHNTYPQVTAKRAGTTQEIAIFPSNPYQITTYLTLYNWDARFLRAVLYVTQYDESLFNYYSIVNEYKDKHYVRADEPDFTNIKGGVGIFGSLSVDSLVVALPQYMFNWPPRWDAGVFSCPPR